MTSTDVALFSDRKDGLSHITREFAMDATYAELAAPFADSDGNVQSSDDFGPLKVEKAELVGQPFFLYDWQFGNGDLGAYVTCFAVLPDNSKVVFADGSTGILKQLVDVTDARVRADSDHPVGGLLCKRGLRVSKYTATDEKGKQIPAETYYIA